MTRIAKLLCRIDHYFQQKWPKEFEGVSREVQASMISTEIDLMIAAHDIRHSYLDLMERADKVEAAAIELEEKVRELKGIRVMVGI